MENEWEFRNIGIVVRDLDKTLEYYQSLGIFAFATGVPEVRVHTDEMVYGKPVPFKTRSKTVRLGPVRLELIQPVEGNGIHMEFLNRYGEGIQHIDFIVNDLEAERARLVEKGLHIMLIRENKTHFTCFDTRRVGNIIIELVQRGDTPGMKPLPPASVDWDFLHLGAVVSDAARTVEYCRSLGVATCETGIGRPSHALSCLTVGWLP